MSNQVFVSYGHKDGGDFIRLLKDELTRHDLYPWIDTDIPYGSNWSDTIDKAIRTSFAVIVVVTPSSNQSKYVTYEWSYALGLGIPVMPILVETTTDIHPVLERLQWFDFTGKKYIVSGDLGPLVEVLNTKKNLYSSTGASEVSMQWFKFGRDQHREGDLRNALSSLQEATKFASPALMDDIQYEIATIRYELGEYDFAQKALDAVLANNPKHPRALLLSGSIYRILSDRAAKAGIEAERYLNLVHAEDRLRTALDEQASLLEDNGESAYGALGGVLKRLNRLDEAVKAYKAAAKVKKTSYPYNNLGLLYMEMPNPNPEQIIQNFRIVEMFADSKLMQEPGDEWAHNDRLIARLVLQKFGQVPEALEALKLVGSLGSIGSLLRTLKQLLNVKALSPQILDNAQHIITELETRLQELEQEEKEVV